MTEEERIWSRRHTHESTTVSYGQFGTPTYHGSTDEWSFIRAENSASIDENSSGSRAKSGLLMVLSEPEFSFEVTAPIPQDVAASSTSRFYRKHPDLAAATSLVRSIANKTLKADLNHHEDGLIAFGSATWLGADGVDSGNLTVPIIAHATGSGNQILQLACLGRENFEYTGKDNIKENLRTASLSGNAQATQSGIEPILQVTFSQPDLGGHAGTYVAVRRVSHTSILEPLLRRDTFINSPSQQESSLDTNTLVTLDLLSTGGHEHADCVFNPLDHRTIALVDVQGNWSIWKVRGRRSTAARKSYQARLIHSGKIFSWEQNKRPAGIGLYFDGWHKILWLSSNGQEIDRLLVCNRRMIKVYDATGQEICLLDPRLGREKTSGILDVRPGPRVNLCLILTSSSLLMFDFGQNEWKDPIKKKGPALLCGFQHFSNQAEMSLKATTVSVGNSILVGLFTADCEHLILRQIFLSETDKTLSATVSGVHSLSLTQGLSRAPISTVVLAHSEVMRREASSVNSEKIIVRVIVRLIDSSVYSFWTASNQTGSEGTSNYLLKLPPNRSLYRKSERHVEDADDTDDFVVPDFASDSGLQAVSDVRQLNSQSGTGNVRSIKHIAKLIDAVGNQVAEELSHSTLAAGLESSSFEASIRDLIDTGDTASDPTYLSDLVSDRFKTADLERDSEVLRHAIDDLTQNDTSLTVFDCHGIANQTLLNTYKTIFSTFIESLSTEVPGRFRLQKERLDRNIALEQYLAGYLVHNVSRGVEASAESAQEVVASSQAILSDPVQGDNFQTENLDLTSASQPLPRTNPTARKPTVNVDVLSQSLSRLRCWTKISKDLEEVQDGDTIDNLGEVLSHLPESFEEEPDAYDYQDKLMSNATAKADINGKEASEVSRARRKAERLAKIRKRAEHASLGVSLMFDKGTDKQDGDENRAMRPGRQKLQQDKRILPIRGSGARYPIFPHRVDVAQSQDAHAFSDGHLPIQNSSQADDSTGNMPLTQPERGNFANRVDINSQVRAKKKKKRAAGF